jgi:Rad3-related DNA helicase
MNKDTIKEKVQRLVGRKFGKEFSFRPGQLEAIVDIIDTYLNTDISTYVLEAPTGSGKSLIAMICSSFFQEQDLRGYILTSELALQDQYVVDFNKYGLGWGCVKGSDTYNCAVNLMPFSLGECKVQKVSYEEAESLPCFPDCGYLMNRKIAIESSVSLLNYSYALIQRNYVEEQQQKQGKGAPFPQRDFVFCDEAHRIIDIVQGHFSPRINQSFMDAIKYLERFQLDNGYRNGRLVPRMTQLISDLEKEEGKSYLRSLLYKLYNELVELQKVNKSIADDVSKMFQKWTDIPTDWRKALSHADRVKDVYCKVEDYLKILKNGSYEKMVKTVNPTAKEMSDIVFNYVDEGYLVDRYFNRKFGFKVLMSATFGNPKYFMNALGASNVRFNRIKSTFDFSKSPIYFRSKNRLSYRNIDEKTPELVNNLINIMLRHPDYSGIVHSGSYKLAKSIYDRLPVEYQKRVHLYNGSAEKVEAINGLFQESSNTIVMGPSLLEGIDLRADISRLQVFLKVPYPSMANSFVKEKMKHYPDWYRWKAEVAIKQGVGRSIRSHDDWAITYFLDGCLTDILSDKHSFDEEFRNRLVYIK